MKATDPADFTFDGLTYYARELGDFTGTVTVLESLQAHLVGKVTVHAHSTRNRFTASATQLQFPDTKVGQGHRHTARC